jgi:hypothetical protein
MPVTSAMMKAPTPMIGGMIWPMQLAVASTPPAKAGAKPTRFISGMVKAPVETTFAGPEPLIVPKSAEATTALWAGPPRSRPVRA